MFNTKSAQKEYISDLNRGLEKFLDKTIRNSLLSVAHEDRDDQWEELYWNVAYYAHQWNEKRLAKYRDQFPAEVAEIEKIVEQVKEAKAAPIVAKEKPEVKKIEERVQKSVHEIIELRKSQYETGIKLVEIFGNLPVSVNCHLVTNQFGRTFTRCFYYMNGNLTPLNLIVAVLQDTAED